jgi:hypothetical protein
MLSPVPRHLTSPLGETHINANTCALGTESGTDASNVPPKSCKYVSIYVNSIDKKQKLKEHETCNGKGVKVLFPGRIDFCIE